MFESLAVMRTCGVVSGAKLTSLVECVGALVYKPKSWRNGEGCDLIIGCPSVANGDLVDLFKFNESVDESAIGSSMSSVLFSIILEIDGNR